LCRSNQGTHASFGSVRPQTNTNRGGTFWSGLRGRPLFDKELAALDLTPFEFRFRFDDVAHDFENGDWEAPAMFYNAQKNLGMTIRRATPTWS
jgi:hypothetical protein